MCCKLLEGGTQRAETEWLTHTIKTFLVYVPGKAKPKFHYRLPLVGDCCRAAWVLAVGFPNPRNSRVQNIEAVLRRTQGKPEIEAKPRRQVRKYDTRTFYARAFVEEYILTNSQESPCRTKL